MNLGLGFYYASVLFLIAGVLIAMIPCLGLLLSFVSLVLINDVAPLLGLIGSFLCLWAPPTFGRAD